MNLIEILKRNISNFPGWISNIRIVVIESDDWGSLRMPSKKVFNTLQNKGLDITSGDSLRYNQFDNLATSDDLSALFDVLTQAKDNNGNTAVLSPITITANPDFKKIEGDNFQKYYFEPFTETLKRQPGCEKSFSLWKEGIKSKIFVPQFHGREHLNVQVWMDALRNNDRDTLIAFKHGCWGFNNRHHNSISYQAAFDIDESSELGYQKEVIISGLQLFEELFGYKASYFVPPNGPLNRALEKTAADSGIKYLFSSKIHREPIGNGRYKKRLRIPGQQNTNGQIYMNRNCFFEPSQEGKDWVASCLNDISIAFRWHKPAVISTHRVNYIGALEPENRDKGLLELIKLLRQILKLWPNVVFMTSAELGDYIALSKK